MAKFKVFNTINGKEGYCGTYQANSEIGACVAHIRWCGSSVKGRLTSVPTGYRVERV